MTKPVDSAATDLLIGTVTRAMVLDFIFYQLRTESKECKRIDQRLRYREYSYLHF